MYCLSDRSGKTIEKKAWTMLLHPVCNDTNSEFIRHEQPLAGCGIGFTTQGCTTVTLGAQKGPGRNMGNIEEVRKSIGLSPLP